MAKTQNPLVHDPRFKEFMNPSVDDFVGGDRGKLLMFPIRALKRYLLRMEQYCPDIFNLLVCASKGMERVS